MTSSIETKTSYNVLAITGMVVGIAGLLFGWLILFIPSIDKIFYLTTTVNNCLPSLHSAMTILVAYCLLLTGNKKLKYFGIFVAITVIISVVYLSIHWLIDVFIGITISLGVILLLRYYMKVK